MALRRVLQPNDGGVFGAAEPERIEQTTETVLAFASLGAGRYDDLLEPAVRFLSSAKTSKEEDQYLVWSAIGAAHLGRYPELKVELGRKGDR